jgi:hypothetical protein
MGRISNLPPPRTGWRRPRRRSQAVSMAMRTSPPRNRAQWGAVSRWASSGSGSGSGSVSESKTNWSMRFELDPDPDPDACDQGSRPGCSSFLTASAQHVAAGVLLGIDSDEGYSACSPHPGGIRADSQYGVAKRTPGLLGKRNAVSDVTSRWADEAGAVEAPGDAGGFQVGYGRRRSASADRRQRAPTDEVGRPLQPVPEIGQASE